MWKKLGVTLLLRSNVKASKLGNLSTLLIILLVEKLQPKIRLINGTRTCSVFNPSHLVKSRSIYGPHTSEPKSKIGRTRELTLFRMICDELAFHEGIPLHPKT